MSTKHAFLLGITHISKDPGSTLNFDLVGHIDDLKVGSSYVDRNTEIEVSGIAEAVHGGILISGQIVTSWNGECRRCLEDASGRIDILVRELFERQDKGLDQNLDTDTYRYVGEVLDLKEMVKDQVLLELPIAPLCKVDCRGLCIHCGVDLNQAQCDCEMSIRDPRWHALDALLEKDR